jgi:hypothetical protein
MSFGEDNMAEELPGEFYLIQKNEATFGEIKTKHSIQKEINSGVFIPPTGHTSILKTDGDEHTIVCTGGVDFEQGKEWDISEDLFAIKIKSNEESMEVKEIKQVKSFGTTSAPEQVRMERCSAMFGYMGGAMIDLNEKEDSEMHLLKFGGQHVDLIKTDNRMEEIIGDQKFLCEKGRDGQETKVSEINVKAYPAKKRDIKHLKPPAGYDPSKEDTQINTPLSRTGHAMAKLDDSTYLMTGGITIPDAGPKKHHPTDSSTWLLNPDTKEWTKCNECDPMIRAGHAMIIHNRKAFIYGGYRFYQNKATKLFSLSEIIEAVIINEVIIITKTINLTNISNSNLPNLYGFSYTNSNNFLYCYGGFNVPKYDANIENLHDFHNPSTNRHKLLTQSSILYKINVQEATVSQVEAPTEFKTAKGSLHILSKTDTGEAEKMIILGGTNRQMVLYSRTEFPVKKCDLQQEYGGCKLVRMTPLTISGKCVTCGETIHMDCDMFKHILKKDTYKCPSCKNIDGRTGRQKTKSRRNIAT